MRIFLMVSITLLNTEKVGRKVLSLHKSREKIVALLSEDGRLSATALAEKIGISPKAVEKNLANLKADGIIECIGPAKGGYWSVKHYGG